MKVKLTGDAPTKERFLEAYEAELKSRYAWAEDKDNLARFMGVVRDTLHNRGDRSWNFNGESTTAAWRAIGCKGKPTLKGLRALISDPATEQVTAAILHDVELELRE